MKLSSIDHARCTRSTRLIFSRRSSGSAAAWALGQNVLRQRVGGLGRIALRRIFAQQLAQDVHAAGKLSFRFQEPGHCRVADEAALDRRAQNQIAPLELADRMVRRRHLHDLGEGHLHFGPLFLDDLDIVDDLGRRAKLQMNVQQHLHCFPIGVGAEVPLLQQLGQPLARFPQCPGEIVLAQRKQLGRGEAVWIGALAPGRQHPQRLRRRDGK